MTLQYQTQLPTVDVETCVVEEYDDASEGYSCHILDLSQGLGVGASRNERHAMETTACVQFEQRTPP